MSDAEMYRRYEQEERDYEEEGDRLQFDYNDFAKFAAQFPPEPLSRVEWVLVAIWGTAGTLVALTFAGTLYLVVRGIFG